MKPSDQTLKRIYDWIGKKYELDNPYENGSPTIKEEE